MAAFPRIPVSEFIVAGEAELKTGPFGTQLKASEYTEEGTPVINVRNIGMGSIKADKLEFISDATRDRLSSPFCAASLATRGAARPRQYSSGPWALR